MEKLVPQNAGESISANKEFQNFPGGHAPGTP